MAPYRASSIPSLATVTDEEILDLVGKLRLSVVSTNHQPLITETASRLVEMLSLNPQVQVTLAQETAVLGLLHDLFKGFQVGEAALLSGLALLQCLADGPACCKDSITQCMAWAQPTALLAVLVALLKDTRPAVVAAAAGCLCTLSSDAKQQVVCCRVLLQQYKHRSAATLLAGILKEGVAAEKSAIAAVSKTLRRSVDIPYILDGRGYKASRPSLGLAASHGTTSANSSRKEDKDLSTHSVPIAAVTKKASPCYQPPLALAAIQAALTLQNLAEAVPANLAGEKGVISALVCGLGSRCPELQLPCLKAVAAITASKSAAILLAKCQGGKAIVMLAGLKNSSQDEVSNCASMALRIISRYYTPSPWFWRTLLCQEPKVYGGCTHDLVVASVQP